MARVRGWNAPPWPHKHLPAFLFLQCAAAFIHLPFHPISTCSSLRFSQARPGTRILRATAAGARCEAWKPLPIEVEKPPSSTAIIGGGPAGVSFSHRKTSRGIPLILLDIRTATLSTARTRGHQAEPGQEFPPTLAQQASCEHASVCLSIRSRWGFHQAQCKGQSLRQGLRQLSCWLSAGGQESQSLTSARPHPTRILT